jgi:hypothetical protein
MSKIMGRRISMAVITAAMALGVALSPAHAVTVGFVGINPDQQNLSGQLSVDVTQLGGPGSNVQFVFRNNVGIASNVSEIYFDWTTGLFSPTIVSISENNAGLNFSPGGSPPDLPDGNTISFAQDTRVSADNPSPQNGINSANDALTIVLDPTSPNFVLTDLIGALRIGLHVQAIGTGGGSDSYVTNPITPGTFSVTPVPLPGSVWLFGAALAGLGALKLKRRRQALSSA